MVQVIKYGCCGVIFAAAREPECYTDRDWLKNLRKYVLRGDTVEVIKSGDWKFGKCECKEKQKESNPNQTELQL